MNLQNTQHETKASILTRLAAGATCYTVDPFTTFKVKDWVNSSRQILSRILEAELGPVLAVRSSALDEFSSGDSKTGKYRTELNVPPRESSLTKAIGAVIESYQVGDTSDLLNSEVIVQRQLVDVTFSGVSTSRDLIKKGPYIMIEYDNLTGRTDTVTRGEEYQRVYVIRNCMDVPPPWGQIVLAHKACETLLNSQELLIEFAVNSTGAVHIFQARVSESLRLPNDADEDVMAVITQSKERLKRSNSHLWSDMADWNPSEMLGPHPKPLDVSLYRRLITDRVWTEARVALGYGQVNAVLMSLVAGRPYINVAKSVRSLLPAKIPRRIADQIVTRSVKTLCEHPSLHDKLEFEVLIASPDPELGQAVSTKYPELNLTDRRCVQETLDSFYSALLSKADHVFSEAERQCDRLGRWRSRHALASLREKSLEELLAYVSAGLQQCARWGTRSFAKVARVAFAVNGLLRRAAGTGIIENECYTRFLSSIHSVSHEYHLSASLVASHKMTAEHFFNRFGHLRPQSYSILSPRYAAVGDPIDVKTVTLNITDQLFELTDDERVSLAKALDQASLTMNVDAFLALARKAIELRETVKFVFTTILSDCLEAVADVGERVGLTREEMSFLTIGEILSARTKPQLLGEATKVWRSKAAARRTRYMVEELARVPSVICSYRNVEVVKELSAEPNYIGTGCVDGSVLVVDHDTKPRDLRQDAIVVIEAADPGYDWIFASQIRGLLTCYGGAGSHMALRCLAHGIPGAIGCGQNRFENFKRAKRVRLDCERRSIEILS